MPNYQHGKIYAIRSHMTDDVYYGSTCESLAKRLYGHRRTCKCYQAGKCTYVTSSKLIEKPDHYIELVENCPCNDTYVESHMCHEYRTILKMSCVVGNRSWGVPERVRTYRDLKYACTGVRKRAFKIRDMFVTCS